MKTKTSALIIAGLLIPPFAPAQDATNASAATPTTDGSASTGTVIFFR